MITLVPIGGVEKRALDPLRQPLEEAFGQRVQVGDKMELLEAIRNARRGQYLASRLLAKLPVPDLGDRVLGVVDVDIYAHRLNFVFGEAEIGRRRALISLARLRQEYYDLPVDEQLFSARALKEAVHELGHTYGLKHCSNPACVMHFSNSLDDTDFKGWNFCAACKVRPNK